MLVNKATIAAVFTSLKTTFNNAFDAAPSQWQQTAMLVPSGTSQNDYTWLSLFPKMRKWIGDKVAKVFEAFKYTIVNDDWEATVVVDRNDIEDDTLGIYAPQAQMAGYSAKQLPDEIVSDLKTTPSPASATTDSISTTPIILSAKRKHPHPTRARRHCLERPWLMPTRPTEWPEQRS